MKKITTFLIAILFSLISFGQSITLETTSEILELLTTTTADIDYEVNFVDVVVATGGTPGTLEGKITSATTTTVVTAPSVSTYRLIKSMYFKNIHASTTNVITFKKDISATEYQLSGALSLLAGESVVYIDGQGWIKYTSGGVPQQASVSFQVDIQTFTSGTTNWTKPTNFTPKVVVVKLYGAGGGGGAGASLATATVAPGGAGGGGGAMAQQTYLASDLGGTVSVTVGAGGTAGTPGAGGALGGNGGVGGTTSFGTTLLAYGGGGGKGGDISVLAGGGGGGGGTAGAGGTGTVAVGAGGTPGTSNITGVTSGTGSQGTITVVTTHNAEFGGGGGGGHTNVPANSVGGSSLYGGAGGGCGGGHNVTPANVNATAGGNANTYVGGSGGTAGTSGAVPTAGGNGDAGTSLIGGDGGGGGGTSVTATVAGSAGGNGGANGGGGGGGGTGMNPGLGGAGGSGGAGGAYIITY